METTHNPLAIHGFDHLEFYVGNARQAAYFYRMGFGFRLIAYSGPETKERHQVSYVLEQNGIRLVLSTPLSPDHPAAQHIQLHGDGVRDIAFTVDDAAAAYRDTTQRGARGVLEPARYEDEHGGLVKAAIATYGDTVHSFIERRNYRGPYAPGYVAVDDALARPVGLEAIDHVVGNVELGNMDRWVEFYQRVFGFGVFQEFDEEDIATEYSSLRSKVMYGGRVKMPINEPARGRRKSQIQEYLDFYQGPGVQHIALLTGDIVRTVGALRQNGIEFLTVPNTYYEMLPQRVGSITEPIGELRRLGILVDRDDQGYLLQIFTEPVEDRPTLFFEVIQRRGSQGFGKGNFKALFEAIEREQARRGNL